MEAAVYEFFFKISGLVLNEWFLFGVERVMNSIEEFEWSKLNFNVLLVLVEAPG